MNVEPAARIADLLALAMVPGLGPRLTSALLEKFGSAAEIRRATPAQLQTVPHIGPKLSADFAATLREVDVDAELELMRKHSVELLGLGTPDYPRLLAEISDAPHLLFRRGTITEADSKAVALVGSRECTSYGQRMADRIASGLCRAGYAVVSGLARGIDGVAHAAALKAGGRTIAVLAGGLSRIYPPEHATLADQVASSGALITETSMRQAPQAGMFPARNRLISGLSLGVVVIEAHERSGALITAKHALEQNREVFAVPGQADSMASAGCLRLIREGAKLIRNVDDILEDLGGIGTQAPAPQAQPATRIEPRPDLPPLDAKVHDALGSGPRHVDQIATELSISISELSRILMQLELKRLVKRLPGNQYERR